MSHKNAKLLLQRADTLLQRSEATKTAFRLGMPLNEIEEYLDWLEMMRGHVKTADMRSRNEVEKHRDGQEHAK